MAHLCSQAAVRVGRLFLDPNIAKQRFMVGNQCKLAAIQVFVKLLHPKDQCQPLLFYLGIVYFGGAQSTGNIYRAFRIPILMGQDSPNPTS